MRLFDTHCHIADEAFDADRAEVIRRFVDAGVARAISELLWEKEL